MHACVAHRQLGHKTRELACWAGWSRRWQSAPVLFAAQMSTSGEAGPQCTADSGGGGGGGGGASVVVDARYVLQMLMQASTM